MIGERGLADYREWILVALLFATLLAASLFFRPEAPEQLYDPDSAAPGGLLALRLWLHEMGHPVHVATANLWTAAHSTPSASGAARAVDAADVGLLFVYPNAAPYTEEEGAALHNWVSQGGTLVLVGPDQLDRVLVDAFGVAQNGALSFASAEYQPQPLLPDLPADMARSGLRRTLEIDGARPIAPVLASGLNRMAPAAAETDAPAADDASTSNQETPTFQNVTAAVQRVGDGTVWHLSPHLALTNDALEEQDAAYLVPAILRTVPPDTPAAIDAFHLFGLGVDADGGEIDSVRAWLLFSQIGRATLFGMALVLLYLILQGRRLGPPLPVQSASRRREAAEYVQAMANLQQRARQQPAVAAHLKQRLKTSLGRQQHLRTDLDDAAFVAQLRQGNRGLSNAQIDQIGQLLHLLNNSPTEEQLIHAVGQIDQILN